MKRPAKPDFRTLIGRTIVAIEQRWCDREPCRSGEWCVDFVTLDDGTELAFAVGERDAELVVDLIHRKGVSR